MNVKHVLFSLLFGFFSIFIASSLLAASGLVKIEGVVVSNEHGNRNGILTIHSGQQQRSLFYDTLAFDLRSGQNVSVLYRPEKADYDGVIVSINVGQNMQRPPKTDTRLPPAVFEDRGACPFECCEYRDWIAEADVDAHQEMRESAAIAFRVKKGEKVKALTGVVITTTPGKARVTRQISLEGRRAKVGDTVELLTYAGEGTYKLRYHGAVIEPNLDYSNNLIILTEPKSIWWVKLKNKRGQIGWSNRPDSFGSKDACS